MIHEPKAGDAPRAPAEMLATLPGVATHQRPPLAMVQIPSLSEQLNEVTTAPAANPELKSAVQSIQNVNYQFDWGNWGNNDDDFRSAEETVAKYPDFQEISPAKKKQKKSISDDENRRVERELNKLFDNIKKSK